MKDQLFDELVASGFCRKFAFELISGMISCGDSGCQERESDDGDQL